MSEKNMRLSLNLPTKSSEYWQTIENKCKQLNSKSIDERVSFFKEVISDFHKQNYLLMPQCNDADYQSFVKKNAYMQQFSEYLKFDALNRAISSQSEEKYAHFCNFVTKVTFWALKMPKLFPEKSVKCLNRGISCELILSRKQILCLLSHMVLGTLSKQGHKYWVSFTVWFSSSYEPPVAYLSALIDYFLWTETLDHDCLEQTVIFKRLKSSVIPNWKNSSCSIKAVTVHPIGSVGDKAGEAEIIFANCDVGYGETGTQEEIVFGSTPEICVAVLFIETLDKDETLYISGHLWSAQLSGYGFDVKYKGCGSVHNRTMVAMDALELPDSCSHLIEQLSEENVVRELNKAFCGFSNAASFGHVTIATGNWGCGTFQGDKEVKSAIQVMAASAVGVSLSYYARRQDFAGNFQSFLYSVSKSNVADLYRMLQDYKQCLVDKQIECSFYEFCKQITTK